MGAKTCLIAYASTDVANVLRSRPSLDRGATRALVERVFPASRIVPKPDTTLAEAYPHGGEILAGCFPHVSLISAKEFAPDRPSQLKPEYLRGMPAGYVYLHAMHSVVDWFAYAIWKDGTLIRSLSVAPDSGVIEDIGPHRAFEEPFWAGGHNPNGETTDATEYPLPFHPLEFGEAALLDLFGFQLEGAESTFDPFQVPLCSFDRRKKWWRWW